jgi:hypothetical protein
MNIKKFIMAKFLIINLLFISIIIKKLLFGLKVLLCTIGKEENKYIKEFINHYRKLKIKKIILYDNNDIDGEKFQDILENEIANNFVEIINYRGFQLPQEKAIINCYKNYSKNYDWIAFYDIDEFLQIINFTNINKFLSLPKFKKCQSILINWKNYGDNNQLYYEPKPVIKRFTKPFYFTNKNMNFNKYLTSAAKTIVRGGLNIIWQHLPHYLNNTIKCRPDGKILNNYFTFPQYSIAYINHYTTKSTEEFAERLNKGDVIVKIDDNFIRRRINNYYFFFNIKTQKKINLLKEKLKYKINF